MFAAVVFSPAHALAIVGGSELGASPIYDSVGGLGFANRVGLEGPLPTPNDTWHCTATLVAPDLVLTARHCLGAGNPFVPYDPTSLAMVFRRNPDGSLGVSDMGAADRGLSSYFRVRIAEVRTPDSGFDDIAIARLATPVTHIVPAKTLLQGGEIITGARITLAGWGRSTAAVDAPLIGLKACTTSAQGYWAPPSMIVFPDYQAASCGPAKHDSGGPVFVQSPAGELRVLGVVNAGNFGEGLPANAALPALGALVNSPFAGADLSIDGYVHEQRFYRLGEDFALDVTIRNSGTAQASGIRLDVEVVDGSAELFRQHLHTQAVSAPLAPGESKTVTVRFAVPVDASQSYHALAVRVASNDDVFASNNRHIPPSTTSNGPSAYFYAVPRVLEYGDVYASFVYGPAETVAGAVAVYERANGDAVALVMGPGGDRVVEGLSLQDRSLSLGLPTAQGDLAFTGTYPSSPIAEQSTPPTPLVFAADAGFHGTSYRDSRFGGVFGQGRANPGAGYFAGVFTDERGGAVHAIVSPSANVYVVAPGVAPSRSFALWNQTSGSWASNTILPDSATTQAAIRFDASVDQYVAEGTWATPEGKLARPFRLIREASRLSASTRCHDDGECQAVGFQRCDALRHCSNNASDAGASSSSGGSSGSSGATDPAPPLGGSGDQGAVSTDGSNEESSGCQAAHAGGRGVELSALGLLGLACLFVHRARARR